ncbi:DoxX family protein [Shewanella sp. A25]|nr:DoxX family protein [Shewanella shenzhenensis]
MSAMNPCFTKIKDGQDLSKKDPQQLYLCAHTLNRAAAVITLAISIVFFISGMGKLLSLPFFHVPFTLMNLPTGFGYVVGLVEVVAAFGLGFRDYRVVSASALLAIMMGALYYHFSYETAFQAVPALTLSAVLFLIIKLDETVDKLVRFQKQLLQSALGS